MWTKVPKPNSYSWQNTNPSGRTQYDQSNVSYDDSGIFYDGEDPNSWTKITKPTTSNWTKIVKPT